MRAARVDRNHGELVGLYRELGCSLFDTSRVGMSFPDLVIGICGITELVEIKTEEGALSPRQTTFHRDWRGARPIVVRSRDDVLAHVQRVRRAISKG